MVQDTTLPYDETPFPGWGAAVDSWVWQPIASTSGRIEGWSKTGDCPRCEHLTRVEIGLIQALEPVEPASKVYAECECKTVHQAGQVGCGVSAMVNGPDHG